MQSNNMAQRSTNVIKEGQVDSFKLIHSSQRSRMNENVGKGQDFSHVTISLAVPTKFRQTATLQQQPIIQLGQQVGLMVFDLEA